MAGVPLMCRWAHQSLNGGSYSSSACQALDGPASGSDADAGMWGERGYGGGSTHCVTQKYCLASMAAWLSSTGISYFSLLPHVFSVHLSTVNISPCPGIAPQSLSSNSQLLHLLGDLCPCLGYMWL